MKTSRSKTTYKQKKMAGAPSNHMLMSRMKSKHSSHVSDAVRTVSCCTRALPDLKALAKQTQCTALLWRPAIYSQQAAAEENLKNNCNDQ